MNGKNIRTGSIISAVLMTAVFSFAGIAAAATSVTPSNLNNWYFYNDQTDTQETNTTDHGFVFGPGTPPVGSGSAHLTKTTIDKYGIATTQFASTSLSSITALSYSTYRTSGTAAQVPSLGFDVDSNSTDGITTYEGRLTYEPYFTQTVNTGAWQTWDTLAGAAASSTTTGNWWFSRATLNGAVTSVCTQADPCTWSEVLAAYPNAAMRSPGQLILRTTGADGEAFDGNVDNLTIGITGSTTTTYDFDPNPLPTVVYVNSATGSDTTDCSVSSSPCATIAYAVSQVASGGTVNATGSFTGDITLSKSVSLVGSGVNTASTTGMIQVNTASTSISGFTITNPNGNFGVMINGVGSVSVTGNTIDQVGSGTASGNAYGVYFQDMDTTDASSITVSNNTISNIGRGTTSGNGSNGGVGFGDSTGTSVITGVVISANTISNILANSTSVSPGKGAYGILLNHANTPSGGSVSAQITNNSICDLSGRWAHGIGLEGNTPNTSVTGNTICNATSTNNDAWGITVQDNSSASSSSLVINNNTITNTAGGVQNGTVGSCSISSNPTSTNVGGTLTLTFNCVNTGPNATINNGVGTVPSSGSVTTTPNEAKTYTYTITATSTDGVTPVSASVNVNVNPAGTSGGNGGGGGGGGGGGNGPIVISPAPVTGGTAGNTGGSTGGNTGGTVGGNTGGQVLGASTFNFTENLTIGSTGTQVIELQKFLIAQGFSIPLLTSGSATYGYFGAQTRAAVAAYQSAHGIKPAVGYFGPLTRAVVNATVAPVMTDAQRAALIASLTAQLQALQAQLAAIIAAKAAGGR